MSNQDPGERTLNPWYVPYAFGDAEMTIYPLNCNIDPDTGKIRPPGMRVYMADQVDAEIARLRSLVEVANTDRRHQASTLIDAGSNPAGDAIPDPLCEKCGKRMIQVSHDTWEYNCEHGTV